MPKDELDPDDPMELFGVGLVTDEDTTDAMAECFIEEFLRLGYNHKQVFALFRNPWYTGVNMVLQNRGEPYVRDKIAEVFARWGRPVKEGAPAVRESAPDAAVASSAEEDQSLPVSAATVEMNTDLTDPMGGPVPRLATASRTAPLNDATFQPARRT